MQQQGSNILHIDPSPQHWGWGQMVKIHFLEHGHVAYQIKGIGKCSSMQPHILSLHTPLTPGMEQKVNTFFLKVVMLDIKSKEMELRAPCKHMFGPVTHARPLLDPWSRVKRSKHFFTERSHFAYKIKGNGT